MLRRFRNRGGHRASFDEIYRKNLWGTKGGGSGGGSELSAVLPMCIRLARFIDAEGIDRIVDISCGAMAWWPTVLALTEREVAFTGYDVSEVVIERNRAMLASFPNMSFEAADAVTLDLPACDLLVCRETINHLPRADAATIVKKMAEAEARFFMLSQTPGTGENPEDDEREVKLESAFKYTEWNLGLEPFGLGAPVVEIPDLQGRVGAIYRGRM